MGFRRRLFLLSVALIATAVISADVYLASALRAQLSERLRSDLFVRLALVQEQAERAPAALDDVRAWDRLANQLGDRSDTRITFVRLDGAVIGDSGVPTAELARLENHRDRPEVRDALAHGRGLAVRHSTTVGQEMMYAAAPFFHDRVRAGVVRAALPFTEIENSVGAIHRVLGISTLIALALALAVATGLTHPTVRAMRRITEGARRMAAGDLDMRIDSTAGDELGEIGRALDRLAASLSATLRDLRAERDLLGGILEAMEEGVLVTKADGSIVLMNPALREMLHSDVTGARRLDEEPVGRSVIEVIRNADLHAILETTLRDGVPSSGEIEVRGPKPRRLLIHAALLSGQPRGCVVVLVDVTEIRRLESMRRDFVANVSHELRTPVTSVRTALETARPSLRTDPAAAEKFLEIAERNAERLVALVRDLLDLSQIESGDQKLKLEPVAVRPLAEQVIALFEQPAARRRVRLRLDLPLDLPRVRADRGALEQVLTNLVDNSVKYGGEGSVVSVGARPAGPSLEITIEDTGPGIAPQHLPRLFERFYRVDAGRSRDRGGTGLGLSIVKHLAEAMQGQVAVESALGRGSKFTVTLPKA